MVLSLRRPLRVVTWRGGRGRWVGTAPGGTARELLPLPQLLLVVAPPGGCWPPELLDEECPASQSLHMMSWRSGACLV